MKKNKVFFIIPSVRGGGAERVILLLAKNLSREKFDIGLVILEKRGEYGHLIPKDIDIFCFNRKRARFAFFDLQYLIKKEMPDQIIASLPQITILLWLTSFFVPKKIIVMNRIECSLPHIYSSRNWIMNFFLKRAIKNSNYIISISNEQKKQLIDFGISPEKIKLIYNPLNLKEIKQLKAENKPAEFKNSTLNILACGRLSEQKGFSYLIKAMKKVSEENPHVALYILGKGPLKKDLEKLVKKLEMEQKVHFLGFKHNPYKYMANSDIFVLSSLYEGFGLVLIEALACGVPVISTDCKTGPREILNNGEFGELVKPENVQELSDKIKYLLENKKLREAYSRKGYMRANDFDIKKIIKDYESFLKMISSQSISK